MRCCSAASRFEFELFLNLFRLFLDDGSVQFDDRLNLLLLSFFLCKAERLLEC